MRGKDEIDVLLQQLSTVGDSDAEAHFEHLSRMVARALRVPVAQVNVLREAAQVSLASFGPEAWSDPREVSLEFSYCRHVVSSGEPLVIDDARDHPLVRENRSTTEAGLVAYAGVPLTMPDGLTIGSLCAFDFEPRSWTEHDTSLLEDFAVWAVAELDRQLRASSAIRETLERYQTIFENSPVGVVMYDRDLRVTSLNDSILRTFKLPPELVRGREIDLHDLGDPAIVECLLAAIDGGTGSFEGSYRSTATGVEARLSIRTWPLRGPTGEVTAGVAIAEDITEREAARDEASRAKLEILERLAQAAEFRDEETGLHTRRVGQLSSSIAETLGLPDEAVDGIRRAAPLHDVGKIGVSDSILLKPGRLTPEEFELMKEHTRIGAQILSGGDSYLTVLARTIAQSHHERWDGGGYPDGLAGESIPLEARIVALADFFDALTHDRPYRKAWETEKVIDLIRESSGSHFDPAVVEAFLATLRAADEGPSSEAPA